jgi:hypothetical protein
LAIVVDLLVKQVVPLHGRFLKINISLTPCNGYSNFVWPVCRAAITLGKEVTLEIVDF